MVPSNIMDSSTSSNAMIQNNAEGLMRKKVSTFRGITVGVETQKKNNCLITCVDGDINGDVVQLSRVWNKILIIDIW